MRSSLVSILLFCGLFLILTTPTIVSSTLTGAHPSTGDHAEYALSISTMNGFICEASKTGMINCPAIADWLLEANGTIAWNAMNVNETTALLSDSISLGFGLDSNSTVSHTFNESIDLATRKVGAVPPVYKDTLLQNILAQYGSLYEVNMSDLSQSMPSTRGSVYTLWWVQTPLSINDNVQILTLTTTVNGTKTVELPSTGSRDALILTTHLERNLLAMPCAVDGCSVPVGSSSFDATFAYDQLSGQLLSANFDLQTYQAQEFYYSKAVTSYTMTMGSTIALHVSLTLQEANRGFVYTGVTVNDPNSETSASAGTSNNRSPTTSDTSHSASPTLVATISEPRNVATISVLIAILGLAGLVVLRRTRNVLGHPSAPAT